MHAHPSLKADFENQAKSYLPALIDSTVLKMDCTWLQVKALCEEAMTRHFRSVCVPPAYVSRCAELLGNTKGKSNVLVCTVVGFPNGYSTPETKAFETDDAIWKGADEIDFVQNVSAIKDGNWDMLERDCAAVLSAAKAKLVKIILETSHLNPSQIETCARVAAMCGIPVIKTSTGFGTRGASLEDLEAIKRGIAEASKNTNKQYGIKASGGIKTQAQALKFIHAGATRIGTSSGAAIVDGNNEGNSGSY